MRIDDTIYRALAAELAPRLPHTDFFNGSVEYDTEELHASLICTLVVRRDPEGGRVVSAIPVWWEFHLFQAQGEVSTDFSWREFSPYLETRFGPSSSPSSASF